MREGTLTDLKSEEIIEDVITRVVRKKGYEAIKANSEGYETPSGFENKEEGNILIPDITAKRFGAKSYFEIAVKTDLKRKVVNKWKLLSLMARAKGGKFHIVAPRGNFAFADRLVQKHDIAANIIKL